MKIFESVSLLLRMSIGWCIIELVDPSCKIQSTHQLKVEISQYWKCLNPILRHFSKLYENVATLCYSALPCSPFPIKINFVRLNTFHVFPRPIQRWWNFDDRIWDMSHFWSIGSDWDQADFVTFDDISWCTKKYFFHLWLNSEGLEWHGKWSYLANYFHIKVEWPNLILWCPHFWLLIYMGWS